MTTISKSKYTTGVRCPKLMWLEEHTSEILSKTDEETKMRQKIGKEVGELACNLFYPGEKVPYSPENNFKSMVDLTQKLIHDGVQYIYEAAFLYDNIIVIVDILKNTKDGFEMYEVKSSTDSKGIFDQYYHDVSIQKYVIEKLGYKINNAYLVHLNHKYVRGEALNVEELFTVDDITEDVNVYHLAVPDYLESFKKHLSDHENEPGTEIGTRCNSPYVCPAKDYCWKMQRNIPDYSIFNIFNLGSRKQMDLYYQGIVDIDDIPDDYEMTHLQEEKVLNYKNGIGYIDKKSIRDFLDTLSYPIYHLDFETFQQAVPEWKDISPYQQIPFQYSLHIQHKDGTIEHKEFLAEEGHDPRKDLATHLLRDIPSGVTVLAYNMSFEKGVIKKLAEHLNDLSPQLLAINVNMYDLMIPFQKQYYVTPTMEGRYSIKYVLPALVPHMEDAYINLPVVHNGSEAMNAFATLGELPPEMKATVREGLKEYCKLDTLSMVEIVNKLEQVTEKLLS